MTAGAKLAQAGIEAAEAHADAVTPNWAEKASGSLASYLNTLSAGDTFTSVEVRVYAAESGLPDPPDNRAWGGAFQRAARDHLITRLGYVSSPDPKQHGAPQTLWQKA